MKTTEYTAEEMHSLLRNMAGMYDLARVVDPIECRILEFHDDGRISTKNQCYSIWDAEQKCIHCCSAIACQTGCHQEKKEYFKDQVFHIQSNPVRLKLPDGGSYDAVVELVNIEKSHVDGAVPNDRAAENVSHKAAQYQAAHDPLTHLLNANAFYELSRDRILRSPGSSWVMITANIMDFRLVNILFDLLKGNEVLVKTSALLKQIAEKANGLCGRLGGDQFALLLPVDAYEEEALRETARELAETFNNRLYTCCIHFGVYEMEDASIPVSVMCDRANAALRTIRESLKETVAYFDDSIMQKRLFEQEVISGFQDALEGGQFHMFLQPLVKANGIIYGAEALVRWHRPDGTVLMPGDFIELLEETGLIHELDLYIWECAVRQLSLWKDTDKKQLNISVNMSAKDLYSVDVYNVLTGLTERYGVDSSVLRLEITETALLEDPEESSRVISALREKGFLVEIDDFGKGYSSLSTLKDVPADILKIDMSLLREIENKERSRIIIESVIHLANSLGMDIVAEGLESLSQLHSLTSMGCSNFQGYLFSRPLSIAAFERNFDAQAALISEGRFPDLAGL